MLWALLSPAATQVTRQALSRSQSLRVFEVTLAIGGVPAGSVTTANVQGNAPQPGNETLIPMASAVDTWVRLWGPFLESWTDICSAGL